MRRFRLRRLLQFRLRTLLLFTTAVAVWLGLWSNAARRQRDSVIALRKSGAIVRYDFELNQNEKPPQWPAWFVDRAGVDYFANVVSVGSYTPGFSDANLVHLQGLTDLKVLELYKAHLSHAGLAQVGRLTGLEELCLRNTQLTDAGLIHLQGLCNLKSLDLRGTRVTDDGLIYLQDLTDLQVALSRRYPGQ